MDRFISQIGISARMLTSPTKVLFWRHLMASMKRICGAGLVVLLSFAITGTSHANTFDISGDVVVTKVSDGDSLRSGPLKIRLFGIDAPEMKQTCRDASGALWRCGEAARDLIAEIVKANPTLKCHLRDTDRYGRLVMQCFAGDIDLGATLVERGMALSYRQYSKDYVPLEESAKAAGSGMWKGEFMPPWDWRRAN